MTQASRVSAASTEPPAPASSLSTSIAQLQGAALDLAFTRAEEQQARRTHTITTHLSTPPATHTSTPVAESAVANAPNWAVAMPAATGGQPCHATTMFVANLGEWSVPPGCYADIYVPNPADYVARAGFGYCDWWPLVLHPSEPDLLDSGSYRRGTIPVPGAVVFEAPDVQGAGPAGHYAQVVAVAPGGYWVLITEMNFTWRGGGFGRVDYRYIHVGAGISFIYA